MKLFLGLVCAIFIGFGVFAQTDSLVYLAGEAQGTTYHITYYDGEGRDFGYSIDSLLLEFDLSVSTYHPSSIISRINRNEANVELDSTFLTCFLKAKEIWKITNGAFDPTVYPLVNAWGFGPGKKQNIDQKIIDSILVFVGFDKINVEANRVVKKDPRVGLDFNAFAQGYSVDVVSHFLLKKGIQNFIVEIGGEIYAHGARNSENSWLAGIEKPIDNKEGSNPLLMGLKVINSGVATSGDYRRFVMENGVKYAHHLNPKTGYPTKNNLLSVTVVSPNAITSDATATGILVMGLKKAKKFLHKHPEIQILLIYSDDKGNYQFFQTTGMKDLLINL